jgi:uncharacterized protein YunC (DUF1805 family)
MAVFRSIKVGKKRIQALCLKLGRKNLIVLRGQKGYIMCGYLNLAVAGKFKDQAVKIIGASTINQAIESKVHSCSPAAKKLGIRKGQPIKDVLKIIA